MTKTEASAVSCVRDAVSDAVRGDASGLVIALASLDEILSTHRTGGSMVGDEESAHRPLEGVPLVVDTIRQAVFPIRSALSAGDEDGKVLLGRLSLQRIERSLDRLDALVRDLLKGGA